MSRFFIDRPIFATVLAIVMVLAGLVAMLTLPTAQFPDIVPPQIKISASYLGADAETVAKTVAAPIEQQVNGADYMIYMNSQNSSNGDMLLNVFFEVGTDLNTVLTDVTNRSNLASPQLPEDVRRNGINIQKSTPNILLVVAVQSDGRYDLNYLNNYASINVLDELKRIPGANQASMFGTPDYAMRIWLRPDRMAEKGVTINDIRNAIKEQNAQFPAGKIGQTPTAEPVELTFAVNTRGRFNEPEEFEAIILRANPDGSTLRIKDIGRVELGARSYDTDGRLDGKSMAMILVYQQAGANALDVADQVRAKMKELEQNFPDGISYTVPYDTTEFVKLSIEEVIQTFFEALLLVVLVVYLFLQNWRATLIPCLVVPVSIVGAFAGMYLLGFSINTLTLFGMVLAIGIVVDDAIVVIENVERNMAEFKLDPKEAARRAMDEVTGPVIAIVLVLCAVFIPSAFLGGITGQMYKQFAVTIAISVVISGLMALTLTPALAGIMLKPTHGKKFVFFQWFDRGFDWLTGGYVAGAAWLVKRSLIALLLFGGLLFLTWHMFRIVPTGFVPDEDQGYVIALALLPDGASLDRTNKVSEQISAIAHKNPAVNEVLNLGGFSTLDGLNKPNAATLFITLKPWKERETPELHAFQVVRELQRETAQAVSDARVLVFNPPAIPGLGATAGFEFWLQNRGEDNPAKLAEALQKFMEQARQRPELTGLAATFNANSQQLFVDLDRDKARALGININDVFDLLQGLFGTVYVNDFNKLGRTFRVLLQAEPEYRTRRTTSTRCTFAPARAAWSHSARWCSCATSRVPTSSAASTSSRPPASTAAPRPATVPAKPSRRWSRSLVRPCRRPSLPPGPARRFRKNALARPRRSPLCSA